MDFRMRRMSQLTAFLICCKIRLGLSKLHEQTAKQIGGDNLQRRKQPIPVRKKKK